MKVYRLAAGLTQEALAARAGVGVRGIQALERGENQLRRDTLRRLAQALVLSAADPILSVTLTAGGLRECASRCSYAGIY